MNIKTISLVAITVLVILALLFAALWVHERPQWKSIPSSLTHRPANIDRSRIPLGPYTVDVGGLVAGWNKNSVTLYVVMRPGGVHFQRTGEVGEKLEGASVVGMGVTYLKRNISPRPVASRGKLVDGLRLVPNTISRYPEFQTTKLVDSSRRPLKIHCSIGERAKSLIVATASFRGIKHGMCTVIFRPAPHLHVWMNGVQPVMFPYLSEFLPTLYQATTLRIQGAP